MSICLYKNGHIWPFFMFSIPLFLFFFRTFFLILHPICTSMMTAELFLMSHEVNKVMTSESLLRSLHWPYSTFSFCWFSSFYYFGSLYIMLISHSSIASLQDENKDSFIYSIAILSLFLSNDDDFVAVVVVTRKYWNSRIFFLLVWNL